MVLSDSAKSILLVSNIFLLGPGNRQIQTDPEAFTRKKITVYIFIGCYAARYKPCMRDFSDQFSIINYIDTIVLNVVSLFSYHTKEQGKNLIDVIPDH